MKEYLISVISVAILSCLIISVIPSGKTSKTIILCVNVIVGLTVILPIINYFNREDFSITIDTAYKTEENLNTDYLNYSIENKLEYNKKVIKTYLKSKNLNGEVYFDYETDKDYKVVYKKISVKLNKKVIIAENNNINIIEEIKNYISCFLLVDKDIIIIYE
ncbi:MAG: hypothetical protein IJR66_00650 [Clostridia bacterium]|nr:hypothetical protein [Clostridia bacterium]